MISEICKPMWAPSHSIHRILPFPKEGERQKWEIFESTLKVLKVLIPFTCFSVSDKTYSTLEDKV